VPVRECDKVTELMHFLESSPGKCLCLRWPFFVTLQSNVAFRCVGLHCVAGLAGDRGRIGRGKLHTVTVAEEGIEGRMQARILSSGLC